MPGAKCKSFLGLFFKKERFLLNADRPRTVIASRRGD